MKKKLIIYTIAILAFAISANAQKPFKEIGKDNEVNLLTLSNGRYIEYFTYDTLRQIGSVMFNTKTHKVEYFITENDTSLQHILARAKETSRFMSVDPITDEYPELTPYQYASNTPIQAIDLDGLEAAYIDNKTGYIIPASSTINTNKPPDAEYVHKPDPKAGAAIVDKDFQFYGAVLSVLPAGGLIKTAYNLWRAAESTGSTSSSTAVGNASAEQKPIEKPKLDKVNSNQTEANVKPNTKPASKVQKSKTEEQIGPYTKKTTVKPGKGPGQSRAEYVIYKKDDKTIKTFKDTYDRGNNFQHRKPLVGGPEGRTQ